MTINCEILEKGAIAAWGDFLHVFSLDENEKGASKIPLPDELVQNMNHNAIFRKRVENQIGAIFKSCFCNTERGQFKS